MASTHFKGPIYSNGLEVPTLSADGTSLVSADETLLVLSAAGLAAPLIVEHDNQTYTRNSVNGAGDSTFQTLASFTLPAGCMGPNGTLIFEMETQSVGAVATSAFQLYIGATAISVEVSWTAATYDNRMMYWFNTAAAVNKYRGTTLRQANSATGFTATAVDTSVSNVVDIKCRWGGAANAHSLSLHSYRALVEFGA